MANIITRRSLLTGAAALAAYAELPASAQQFPRRKFSLLNTRLRVNRNHALARNLLDCYVFSPPHGMGLVCLGDQRSKGAFGGTHPGNFQAAPEPSIYVTTAGNVADPWFSIPNYLNYCTGDCAAFIRFMPKSFSNSPGWIFVKDGAGFAEFAAGLDGSGNNSFAYVGGVNSIGTALTTGYAVGVIADYVSTRTGSTHLVYANGGQIGSFTNSSTTADAVAMNLGRSNGNGAQNGDLQFMCFYTWSRGLTATEVQQLHFDPYAFLVPVFDPTIRKTVVAAGAAVMPDNLPLLGVR